jgi:hypothetical protein
MIDNEFLEKRLTIGAVTAILMLMISGSCVAQSHLELSGAGSCGCSKSFPVDQTASEASSLKLYDNGLQEMNSSSAFKMQPGNCSPLSPAGLISDPRPVFNWTAAYNATKYNLQVYNDNSFAANNSHDAGEFLAAKEEFLVANEWFDAKNVTHGGFCSEFLSVNLLDGVYFWHVQACNAESCGNWSQWRYFENICALEQEQSAGMMDAVADGMIPEKKSIRSIIEDQRGIIKAKTIAAEEKRMALMGGYRSPCNCGGAD